MLGKYVWYLTRTTAQYVFTSALLLLLLLLPKYQPHCIQSPDIIAMAELTTNYFVCTLGEAAGLALYKSVTHLIEQQASSNPNLPAFAFPVPASDAARQWHFQIYSTST